jgi:hypothetical protein
MEASPEVILQSKEIEIVDINLPVPYDKNMNKHTDEQIERLRKLIRYQGFRNPLVLQKGTNIIAAGHGRLIAAKLEGMKTVPVIYQEFESEAQFYAYVVSDNAINSNGWGGGLDFSQINVDITDLGPELDIDMLGIKEFTIEAAEKIDDKPVDINFDYKIEVDCITEDQQQYLTGELQDRGFKVRVLL